MPFTSILRRFVTPCFQYCFTLSPKRSGGSTGFDSMEKGCHCHNLIQATSSYTEAVKMEPSTSQVCVVRGQETEWFGTRDFNSACLENTVSNTVLSHS